MTSSNDNSAPPQAARVLPILGTVDSRGDVVFHRTVDGLRPASAVVVLSFPNHPREP